MRVLITSHESLYPTFGGYRQVLRATIDAILQVGHSVVLVSWGAEPSYSVQEGKLRVVHFQIVTTNDVPKTLPSSRLPSLLQSALSLTGAPQLACIVSRGVSPRLVEKTLNADFDVVIREGPDSNRVGKRLADRSSVPLVERMTWIGMPQFVPTFGEWADFGEFPFDLLTRMALNQGPRFDRIVCTVQRSALSSDDVLSTSVFDTDRLLSIYPQVRCRTILTTVERPEGARLSARPTPTKVDSGGSLGESKDIVFFSGMTRWTGYAVRSIIGMARRLSDFRFLVAGGAGVDFGGVDLPANFHVLGFLSDQAFDRLLRESRAFIFPLLSSHGSQTKLIRAMQYGKPVVTTSVVASAFPRLESSGIAIADEPGGFMRAIEERAGSATAARLSAEAVSAYYNRWLGFDRYVRELNEYIVSLI